MKIKDTPVGRKMFDKYIELVLKLLRSEFSLEINKLKWEINKLKIDVDLLYKIRMKEKGRK